MRLVDIDKFINDFPIRMNHYDEENGSKKFVLGIEVVLDSLDCTPTVEAIPIEWIKKYIAEEGIYPNRELLSVEQAEAIERMIENWEKENEMR